MKFAATIPIKVVNEAGEGVRDLLLPRTVYVALRRAAHRNSVAFEPFMIATLGGGRNRKGVA